jgi:hypothetical protein
MAWIQGECYEFNETNVTQAPNQEGVYGITDSNNKVIYIGQGNLRDRLTAHFRKYDPVDDCIWDHNPIYYYREVCSNSEQREKLLLAEYSTYCNERIG